MQHLVGMICHMYLNDIIIWSQTVEEHLVNIHLVLEALWAASLFCSPKKTSLFCLELDFLGHHLSARGVEVDKKKIAHIFEWPVPCNAGELWSFL